MRNSVVAVLALLALGAPIHAAQAQVPSWLWWGDSQHDAVPASAANPLPVTPIGGGSGMLTDASNAQLPVARDNINNGLIVRSVYDFGAKCDVQYIGGDYSITHGTTAVSLTTATLTGGISGNVFTVSANTGSVQVGQLLTAPGVASNTYIVDRGTGQAATGTYLVSGPPQTVAGGTVMSATLAFRDIGVTKAVILPGHAAGGLPLITTITPTDATHATLGAASVPGTSPATAVALGFLPLGTGSGYAPGDTITMAGGTLATNGGTAAVGTVRSTTARAVSVATAGSGGTDGTWTVYGTTGNGNRGVFTVTVSGGAAASATVVDGGHYTTNPTDPTSETVATSQAGVTLPTGLKLGLTMDVDIIVPTTPGLYASVPTTFTQASTSGSGTGATFTSMQSFEPVSGFVYGTDDSVAFQKAVNPTTWTDPVYQHGIAIGTYQQGAIIQLPNKPCGIASTITRNDSNVRIQGSGGRSLEGTLTKTPALPRGSAIQWLGAVGGEVFADNPSGANSADFNKITGVSFEGGVPQTVSPQWTQPIAARAISTYSQNHAEFGWLSFDGFSEYDIKTDTNGTSADWYQGYIHDISMMHPLYADGTGIILSTEAANGNDTDLTVLERLSGIYQSAPLLKVLSYDNNYVLGSSFFKRGTQNVFGAELSCAVFGSTTGDHRRELIMDVVSTTLVIRGKESCSDPTHTPSDVIIRGFDIYNGVTAINVRPGVGLIDAKAYGGQPVWMYPVSWLPTCNAANDGAATVVSDALTPTYNSAPTGGGAVRKQVRCTSGTGWLLD